MKQTKIFVISDAYDNKYVNDNFNAEAERMAYDGYELKEIKYCPAVYSHTCSDKRFPPEIIGVFEKDDNEVELCKLIKNMAGSCGVNINQLCEIVKSNLKNDMVSVTCRKDCECESMKRLTKRIAREPLVVFTEGEYEETISAEMTLKDISLVLQRLCAYEDTGLTPCDITKMLSIKKDREVDK